MLGTETKPILIHFFIIVKIMRIPTIYECPDTGIRRHYKIRNIPAYRLQYTRTEPKPMLAVLYPSSYDNFYNSYTNHLRR